MDPSEIGDLLERTLALTFMLSAPVLFAGLIVGVLISLVQAATQVNEVTLVFVPKMLAAGTVMWLTGPWMVGQIQMMFQEVAVAVSRVSGVGG